MDIQMWEQKAKELHHLEKLKNECAARAQEIKKELIHLSGGQSYRGENFVFTCHMRRGPIDYKRIPELRSIDLDRYRKSYVTAWKLECVRKK